MNLMEFKSEIMSGELRKIYVITGQEIGVTNIYLNQIAKEKSLYISREENVIVVWKKIKASGMFSEDNRLFVVRGDTAFQKEEDVWPTVENQLGQNMLILLYDKIDSRLKFGKHFSECTVNIEKLDDTVLKRYIDNRIKGLTDSNKTLLLDMCNRSYDIIMLECEKLDICGKMVKEEINELFTRLVKEGTVCSLHVTDVFQFTGAVCDRNVPLSYRLARKLQDDGATAINILGTLYSSMKTVMLIQCCKGSNIAEITGLDNGSIYYNRRRVGKYTVPELVKNVKFLADVVEKIKSGRVSDTVAVDYSLSHIFGNVR